MPVMAQTKLKTLREELQPKVSQEDIARTANIRVNTYRNAEYGRNVSYSTAIAILKAINSKRSECSLSQLTLDDLELHIV